MDIRSAFMRQAAAASGGEKAPPKTPAAPKAQSAMTAEKPKSPAKARTPKKAAAPRTASLPSTEKRPAKSGPVDDISSGSSESDVNDSDDDFVMDSSLTPQKRPSSRSAHSSPAKGAGPPPEKRRAIAKSPPKPRAVPDRPSQPQVNRAGKAAAGVVSSKHGDASDLWTTKYAPRTVGDVIANNITVKRLCDFLRNWSPAAGAKVEGGANAMRAALLSGGPGIGKTTAAHVAAAVCGYEPVELNASDARSRSLLRNLLCEVTDNRGITEFFSSGKGAATGQHKMCIIMDEVDGMSAGDRGGMVELVQLIKSTKVPIICICNDRQSPKVRTLANYCHDLKFRKPTAQQIAKRVEEICRKEGLAVEANVIQTLSESTNGDIRQILNLLQAYSLRSRRMGLDDSKQAGKLAEKDFTFNMFDIVKRLLDGHQFRRETFEQRFGYYFHDYSIIPLMVQENYVKNVPALARDQAGMLGEARLAEKTIELLARAAESISDGDLVDRKIHSAGEWSLMPTHNVFSTLRPAFFAHGSPAPGTGNSWNAYGFPSWLGKNSAEGKAYRQLRDVHLHMSFRVSGDKLELRQQYLPALAVHMVRPLQRDGAASVDAVIAFMDAYYLNKEDWDTCIDLGVGQLKGDVVLKAIPTQAKSSLTRTYNKMSHPEPPVASFAQGGSMQARATALDAAARATASADFEDAVVDEDDADGNGDGEDGEPAAATGKAAGKAAGKSGGRGGSRGSSSSARGRGRGRGRGGARGAKRD